MKKSILAAMAALLLFATPISAHPPIEVYVDGQEVSFDQEPVIIEDRTLVPMRAIFKALGSEVTWSEPTQTITSTKGNDTVVLKIGETGVYKNGQLVYTMAVPAQIINERTLVPIRAIAVAFEAEVSWDPVGYVITIASASTKGYSTTIEAEDGTTVLSFQMDFPQSSSAYAEQIQESLALEGQSLAKDFMNEFGEKAKKEYESAKVKGDSFTPYTYIGSFKMTRDDKEFISFYGTSTQSTGSEPVKGCTSYTFSAKNGKQVDLFDIIKDDRQEVEDFWETSFSSLIDEKPQSFYGDAKRRLEKSMEAVGFYVTEDGIGFYLPPETIAPKEAGVISFTVKYEV